MIDCSKKIAVRNTILRYLRRSHSSEVPENQIIEALAKEFGVIECSGIENCLYELAKLGFLKISIKLGTTYFSISKA